MRCLAVMTLSCCALLFGCKSKKPVMVDRFADDVRFLESHGKTIVLADGRAKVAVSPALQGRVMTSTAGAGTSFGWINRQYFNDAKAGKINPHMGPFGGEDRFWLGPEGGQFSIF